MVAQWQNQSGPSRGQSRFQVSEIKCIKVKIMKIAAFVPKKIFRGQIPIDKLKLKVNVISKHYNLDVPFVRVQLRNLIC